MPRVLLSPEAEDDLDGIADRIHGDNPAAAARWTADITRLLRLLSKFPLIGERYQARRRVLRRFPRGNYVIYYRPVSSGIQVVRILHGARDERNIL